MRRYNNKKSASSVKRAESLAKEVLTQAEKTSEIVPETEKTSVSLCFQCGGFEVTPKTVEDAVAEDMEKKGLEAKNVQIYVNMEEVAAYYVLDGVAKDNYKVSLK